MLCGWSMRTTPDTAYFALTEALATPSFGRVELAKTLVEMGITQAVAIADLGRIPGQGTVTRSVVVQAKTSAALSMLLHRLARGPLPDFSRPDPRTLETPSPLIRRSPGPLNLPDSALGPELRYLRANDLEVHTYLGLFGRPGSTGVGRRWRAILSDLREPLAAMLDRTRLAFPTVSGAIAVDAQGQILAADAGAEPWLGQGDRLARIPTLLRSAREGDAVDGPLDGARIQLRAARGTLGPAWLGTLSTPEPLERASDGMLTPTQRAVAGYAAVGATSAEIARTLGIRVETVRTHIRDIYTRLGISTRAELARRWASEARPAQNEQLAA